MLSSLAITAGNYIIIYENTLKGGYTLQCVYNWLHIQHTKSNVLKYLQWFVYSSAMKGYIHRSLRPITAGSMSELREVNTESHLIFSAETHNFPTGVAPFSGATTGTGGRIRDVQSVGRGGYCIAGTAGYSVGNLNIPGKSVNPTNDLH